MAINFSIRRGEFLAIVGPSGCGKSTLLSLIAGFNTPTRRGAVRRALRQRSGPRARRDVSGLRAVSLAHGDRQCRIRSVRARRGRCGRPRTSRKLIEVVGLSGFEHRYPHELSGGMRQRCALARMLANDPTMWLMDEPLAAVDLQTRIILQDELLRLWGDGARRARVQPCCSSPTASTKPSCWPTASSSSRDGPAGSRRSSTLTCRGRASAARFARGRPPRWAVWDLIRDEAAQAITEEAH